MNYTESTTTGSISVLSDRLPASNESRSDFNFVHHGYDRLRREKHSETCPVCQTQCGHNVLDDVIACKGEDAGRVDASHEGANLVWVKTKEQNIWSGFISYVLMKDNGGKVETPLERRVRLQTAKEKTASTAKNKAEAQAALPENKTRDTYYREILRPVASSDIQDLVSRGWTMAEIANAEVHKVIGRGPRQTDAVNRDFLVLSTIKGNIVGGQVAKTGEAKYIWDNHKFETHVQETGANPHFEAAALKLIPNTAEMKIVVVEGFLKAATTAIKATRENLNWYVLGFAGGDAGNKGLAARIAELKVQFPGIKAAICPDGDVAINANVRGSYSKVTKIDGSYDEVLWFGQFSKGNNIDDVDSIIRATAEFIKPAQYWAYINEAIKDAKFDIFDRYKAGDIKAVYQAWAGLAVAGTVTLVCDQLGDGKSWKAPQILKMDMEAGNKAGAYISNAFRNDKAVKEAVAAGDMAYVNGRNPGLVEVNGTIRAKRPGEHRPLIKQANCFKAEEINLKRAKGVYDNEETVYQLECLGCPFVHECKKGLGMDMQGHEYGALFERDALNKGRIPVAMHANSLPAPDSEWYCSDRLVILDEKTAADPVLYSHQVLTRADLDKINSKFVDNPEALKVTAALIHASDKAEGSFHGLTYSEFAEELKGIDVEVLKNMESLLQNNSRDLNTEHGLHISDMPRELKMRYIKSEGYKEKIQNMIPSFIPNLIQVLDGAGTATLSKKGDFTFSTLSLMGQALLKCRLVLLDATENIDSVSASFGGAIVRAVKSDSKPGAANVLKISTSSFTSNRSEQQRQLARTMCEQIIKANNKLGRKVGIIDSMKFEDDYEGLDCVFGSKFVAHRGSNVFEGCDVIIMMGQMRLNVNAIKAEWEMLKINGRGFDKDFEQFYGERVTQENAQAIGRLRANRRHGEDLEFYVADGSWAEHFDGEISVEQLLRDKATGMAHKVYLIAEAVKSHPEFSLRELARLVGCSHTRVGELLPAAMKLLSEPSYEELLNIMISSNCGDEQIIEVIQDIITGIADAPFESDAQSLEWSFDYEPEELITA